MAATKSPMSPEWSSGLCACFNGPHSNPIFFCGACCGCGFVAHGVLLQDARLVDSWAYPAIALLVADWLTGLALPLLSFISLRHSMSNALQRDESLWYTSCVSSCCYPCAMAQVHRDIYDRNYCFNPNQGMVNSLFGVIEDATPRVYERVTAVVGV